MAAPDSGNWLGLIELLVVLLFGVGWGILELYTLRLDRKKREAAARDRERPPPP